HASEPAWTPSWRTVRSDVGRFSVELPGEPREQTDTNKDAGVEAALHTMSASVGDAGVFAVGWIDLPAAISTNRDALEAACTGALQGLLAREANAESELGLPRVDSRSVVLYDGGAATCALAGKIDRPWRLSDLWSSRPTLVYVQGTSFQARGMVVGGRLYLATAVTAPEHATHPDVERFFQSLHVDPIEAWGT